MGANWSNEFPAAITVCDKNGKILEMNDRACKTFEKDGGASLIGKNVLDCHPEPAKAKLKEMLATGKSNCYTIEKKGVKKMMYQAPWYENGEYKGFVEMSIEIPFEMPHFVRNG